MFKRFVLMALNVFAELSFTRKIFHGNLSPNSI